MAEQGTLTVVDQPVIDLSPSASRSYDTPMVPASPPEKREAKPEAESAPKAEEPAKEPEKPAAEPVKEPVTEPKDETPPEYKSVITREKARRKTAEDALEAIRQQNADLIAVVKRFTVDGAVKTEPKRDAFDDPDQYIEARASWLAEQKIQAREAENAQKANETRQQQMVREHRERLAKAEVSDPGVMDLERDPTLAVNESMAAAIMTSDAGPSILRYLDQHRDDAVRIFNLPPARAAAEIGKIEAILNAPKPKVSAPAKPIDPIGNRGTVVKNKDDPNISSDEFWALHDAEEAAKLESIRAAHERRR